MRHAKPAPNPESVNVPNAAIPDQTSVKTRKRPSYVALGISLIALAAIAGWFTFQHFTTTHPVMALARDVRVGAPIAAEDLVQVEANVPPSIQTVPQEQAHSLLGKRATENLKAGSLLNPQQLSDAPIPAKGTAIVGVKVTPGQMPAQDIKAGDSVTIIPTPSANDPAPTDTPYLIRGTIKAITTSQSDASTVVDISVTEDQSAKLASIAATGNIAIILTSQEQ